MIVVVVHLQCLSDVFYVTLIYIYHHPTTLMCSILSSLTLKAGVVFSRSTPSEYLLLLIISVFGSVHSIGEDLEKNYTNLDAS